MVRRQAFRAKLIHRDIHCDPVAIDYNTMIWPNNKIAPPLEDMFPVLVTCEVIVADMEVKKLEILEQWEKW
jgi:hypothetical protein